MGDSILTLYWTRQALYLSKHKYITFSEGNPRPAGISRKMNYLLSLSLYFFPCTSATILCWREINGLGTSLVWPIVSHSVCLEGRDWIANSILTQTQTQRQTQTHTHMHFAMKNCYMKRFLTRLNTHSLVSCGDTLRRGWSGFFSPLLNSYWKTAPFSHSQNSLGEGKVWKSWDWWIFCTIYTFCKV